MRTPRLNRKLVLEAPGRVPDGAGGFAESWIARGTVWAQVLPGAGSERAGEDVRLSRTRLKIVLRAAPHGAPSRPRPDQRYREGARLFRILSVSENDCDARFLVCHAEEETAS